MSELSAHADCIGTTGMIHYCFVHMKDDLTLKPSRRKML